MTPIEFIEKTRLIMVTNSLVVSSNYLEGVSLGDASEAIQYVDAS
jgi:hypothetical protein